MVAYPLVLAALMVGKFLLDSAMSYTSKPEKVNAPKAISLYHARFKTGDLNNSLWVGGEGSPETNAPGPKDFERQCKTSISSGKGKAVCFTFKKKELFISEQSLIGPIRCNKTEECHTSIKIQGTEGKIQPRNAKLKEILKAKVGHLKSNFNQVNISADGSCDYGVWYQTFHWRYTGVFNHGFKKPLPFVLNFPSTLSSRKQNAIYGKCSFSKVKAGKCVKSSPFSKQ